MAKQSKVIAAVVLLLWIAACAPVSTPSPTATLAPTPTQAVAPTPTLTAAAEPTATAAAQEDPANLPALATFLVVPAETVVSYAVDETFLNQNNRLATAIGKTSQVSGQLVVDLNNPNDIQFSEFTVDISTLTSDSSRRDNAIRRQWLESASFPIAKYTVTGLTGFPADPQEGQELVFQMNGELTVKEATRPLTWDVKAVKNGNRLTGQATTFIMMQDWGVPPPNIAGVLIVKDGVTLTIDFTFEQQS